jgi:hypothetical protein
MPSEIVQRAWSRIPEGGQLDDHTRDQAVGDATQRARTRVMNFDWETESERYSAIDYIDEGADGAERFARACEIIADGSEAFPDADTADAWAERYLRDALGLPQREPWPIERP